LSRSASPQAMPPSRTVTPPLGWRNLRVNGSVQILRLSGSSGSPITARPLSLVFLGQRT
jgi:hypothetical protein